MDAAHESEHAEPVPGVGYSHPIHRSLMEADLAIHDPAIMAFQADMVDDRLNDLAYGDDRTRFIAASSTAAMRAGIYYPLPGSLNEPKCPLYVDNALVGGDEADAEGGETETPA